LVINEKSISDIQKNNQPETFFQTGRKELKIQINIQKFLQYESQSSQKRKMGKR
jgi:hypothetical protein